MRRSLARSRLRDNLPARIVCMYYPVAMMPAYAARAGYDAVWLDTEHNTWDRRELQRMLALHRLADIDCIVRTASRNAGELYHLLEDGATGLMIPLVNTGADAAALVAATKFPPVGQRGLDGAGVDNDFYISGTTAYPPQANAETLLLVQIETPEALDNIDAIAGTPGVDGLFIGPSDLALRLDCPLDWSHPKMVAAQERIRTAAARHGVAWGRPALSREDVTNLARAGARLISHGSDFGALRLQLTVFGDALNGGLEAS